MSNHLFRSLMFVPAHNERLMNSATHCDADILLLDIEDSVQPLENKQMARDNIIRYIADGKFADKIIYPRINDRESGQLLKDVYQLTIPGIEGFVYPKATCGEDIYFIGKLLETIECEKNIPIGTFKLIPLIETTGAVMHIHDICSACSRVVAVAFGCEDFVTNLQGQHDVDGNSIFTARAMIAMAARSCNIFPIDTVHIRVHDLEDLERNLILSKKLGFEGMLVLNPKELELVHKYYSPSSDEIEWATSIVNLSNQSFNEGKGVAIVDGKFIGPPMLKKAQNILDKWQKMNRK